MLIRLSFIILFSVCYSIRLKPDEIMESMSYYDPKTGSQFPMTYIENSLSSLANTKGQISFPKTGILRRFGFRSNGCSCQELSCGCCAGINLNQFNFNREGCMNFTYDPYDFSVRMNMIMNDESVFTNTFSAKNPPPLCLPLGIPNIPIQVHMCAKLYDIHTPGQNLHMCFDFETKLQQASVLVLHFDCMSMGNDGLHHLKPGESVETIDTSSTETSQIDSDIFDQVTEIKIIRTTNRNKRP